MEDDYCTDGSRYLLEVATPQFLSARMKREKSDFLSPGYPYIIVSKLTDEILKASIESFINTENNLYWLKLYHITATLEIEDINEILYRKKKESRESIPSSNRSNSYIIWCVIFNGVSFGLKETVRFAHSFIIFF